MNLSRVLFVTFIVSVATVAGAQTTGQEPSPAPPAEPVSNPFEHLVFGVGFEGFYQYNWNKPYDRINLLR